MEEGDRVARRLMNKISFSKWGEYYKQNKTKEDEYGFGIYLRDVLKTFEKHNIIEAIGVEDTILEIGAGRGYISYGLARLNKFPVCIDFILEPLIFSKRLFEKAGLKGFFIRADMLHLPFKDNSFKFIYSSGVLEHHKSIKDSASEIWRVLKPGGITFNSMPALSLSSLTYGQLYGAVPNFPVIKEIFYFIHHKLLKSRHCIFGFELNYLETQLRKIFRENFSFVRTGVWKVARPVNFIKNRFFKRIAQTLIMTRLFAHMIYVYGEKK